MRRIFQVSALAFILVPIYGRAACNIVNGQAYGDCAGVTVNSYSKGFIKITAYKTESGIIAGANVLPGGSLYLSGISNGDIVVSKNAKLIVMGVVNGTVKNNGGTVEIEGSVDNVVTNGGSTTIGGMVSYVTGSGKIVYKNGAIVSGKPVE
jgi:hypothetical protein